MDFLSRREPPRPQYIGAGAGIESRSVSARTSRWFPAIAVLVAAVSVATAVRCRSGGPRTETVRSSDGTVTKVVFYSDPDDGTNSVLTFRDGVLDGPVVRYTRRSHGSARLPAPPQTVEMNGIYRRGSPWEGTFLGFGSAGKVDDSPRWHGGDWLPVTIVTYSNGLPVCIYDSLGASDSPPDGWPPVRYLSDTNGVLDRTGSAGDQPKRIP